MLSIPGIFGIQNCSPVVLSDLDDSYLDEDFESQEDPESGPSQNNRQPYLSDILKRSDISERKDKVSEKPSVPSCTVSMSLPVGTTTVTS